MWTRRELKERAKAAFKANYWRCVLVAFILALLIGGGAGSSVRKNETADLTTEQQKAMALLAEDDNLGRLVEGMEKLKKLRSGMLYDTLDNSKLFTCPAQPGSRSGMNVAFRTGNAELDAKFIKEATEAGFVNLKGHRVTGGMRASIYNAMPVEGVEKLCDFIRAFDKNNA